MNRIVVNIATGEQTIVPLTQEELDEIASRPAPTLAEIKAAKWEAIKAERERRTLTVRLSGWWQVVSL